MILHKAIANKVLTIITEPLYSNLLLMGPEGDERVYSLNKLWSIQERVPPIDLHYRVPAKQWKTIQNNLEIYGTCNCDWR